MFRAWVMGLVVSTGAMADVAVLDRTGAVSERFALGHVRCEFGKRHLDWTVASEFGTVELHVRDFRSLAHNKNFSLRLSPESGSWLVVEDRFGFEWTMEKGTPSPSCEVTFSAAQAASIVCSGLRNAEMPGLLSFQIAKTDLKCGSDSP